MYRVPPGKPPASLVKAQAALRRELEESGHDVMALLDAETRRELRLGLCENQREVCCYCNKRITPQDLIVEHWSPQSEDRLRRLDWNNLLAACSGVTGSDRHCDGSKANQPISLNPKNRQHIESLRYTTGGKLKSSRGEHDQELNNVLNLN